MALSPNLSLVRVTGSYVNAQGQAAQGSVTFKLNKVLTDRAANQIILNTAVVVNLVNGSFAVDLPATNDPDLIPSTGVWYTVTEAVGAGSRSPFSLPLPFNSAPVDLADVDIVTDPDTGESGVIVLTHSALSGLTVGNDHPQYVLGSTKGQALGVASLSIAGLVPLSQLPVGTASTQVAAGDHGHTIASGRITDWVEQFQDRLGVDLVAGAGITLSYDDAGTGRVTIASTGGVGGTDPEGVRDTIAAASIAGQGLQIVVNDVSDTITYSAIDATTTTKGVVQYGTTAGTAAQGNDARLSDMRVPTANSVTDAKVADNALSQTKIAGLVAALLAKADDSDLVGLVTATELSEHVARGHAAHRKDLFYDGVTWGASRPETYGSPLFLWGGPARPSWALGTDAWLPVESVVGSAYLAQQSFDFGAAGTIITAAAGSLGGTAIDTINPSTTMPGADGRTAEVSLTSPWLTGEKTARLVAPIGPSSTNPAAGTWLAWRSAVGHRTAKTMGFSVALPTAPTANMILARFRSFDDVSTYASRLSLRVTPLGRLELFNGANTVIRSTADGAFTFGANPYFLQMEGDIVGQHAMLRYKPKGGSEVTVGDMTSTVALPVGADPADDFYEDAIGLISNSNDYVGYFGRWRVAASGSVEA